MYSAPKGTVLKGLDGYKRLAPAEPGDPAFIMGGYFLLAGLDDGERDLVTFSKRVMRRAWRVRICVMPPGTKARTIA